MITIRGALGVLALLAALGGCSSANPEYTYPSRSGPGKYSDTPYQYSNPNDRQTIFGDGGILGGGGLGGGKGGPGEGGGGIGVNSFLWRATLDTLAFMPLASADPFGGVIITDWYSPPETPAERFKMTVYILDRQLRADGVKVSVFRQNRVAGDQWSDAGVSPETAGNLENAILRRARQMRQDITQQQ